MHQATKFHWKIQEDHAEKARLYGATLIGLTNLQITLNEEWKFLERRAHYPELSSIIDPDNRLSESSDQAWPRVCHYFSSLTRRHPPTKLSAKCRSCSKCRRSKEEREPRVSHACYNGKTEQIRVIAPHVQLHHPIWTRLGWREDRVDKSAADTRQD